MTVFNRYAHEYDRWYQDPKGAFVDAVETRLALDMLTIKPGMKVLDVGCGTGNFSIRLAQAECLVTGIDVSSGMLAMADEKIAASDLPVEFAEMDALDLKFPDFSFDAVVSMAAFEFIPDVKKAMEEMFRVVRQGGEILVGTINADGAWGQLYKSIQNDASVFRYAQFKSKDDLMQLKPDSLVRTGECLYVSPTAQEHEFTLEREKELAESRTGGFICALWKK